MNTFGKKRLKCNNLVITVITAIKTSSMTTSKAIPSTEVLNLKLVPIGNSFGVRLSRPLLHKYGIEHSVVAEQRPDGILLRGAPQGKATLEQTFTEMAAVQEDWGDMEASGADGLDKLVW
jgi:hypothetical protein